MGLYVDHSTTKSTLYMKYFLTKDLDGGPYYESFAYTIIVRTLLYLDEYYCSDINYSVSQVARFTFCTKRYHESGLKLIGRYLLGTHSKGLIITPTRDLNIDAYPDADFSGFYNYEEHNDPICVEIRTGFVINVAGCPVLWNSQIQSETATITIQSEVLALSDCFRYLILIISMVDEVGDAIGLIQSENSKMHV